MQKDRKRKEAARRPKALSGSQTEISPIQKASKAFKSMERLLKTCHKQREALLDQNKKLLRIQKRIEAALAGYDKWFEHASHPLMILDASGRVLEANPETAGWLGITKKSLLLKPFHPNILMEDRGLFDTHLKKAFRTRARQGCEIRLNIKKKTPFIVHLDSVIMKDPIRKKNLCRTAMTDITEPKQMEYQYHNLVNTALVGIFQSTIKGDIIFANPAAVRMMGFKSFKDMKSKRAFKYYRDPERREAMLRSLKLQGKVEGYEVELITKAGKPISFLLNASLREDILTGIVQDITERKKAEAALKDAEEKYRTLIEESMQAVIVVQDNRIVFASRVTAHILGFEVEALLNLSSKEVKHLFHPEDRAMVWENMKKRLSGCHIPPRYEFRIIRNDGSVRWVEIYASVIQYHGKPAVQGFAVDITARKKAVEALRQSEEKYRLLSENIPVIVYSARPDQHSTPLFLSGKISELTGYTAREFMSNSKRFDQILHPDDSQYVWTQIKAHRRKKIPLDIQYRIITKTGKTKWIRDKATPILDDRGRIIRIDGFNEDITANKRIEEELFKAKTLESVGVLAGGIAHDFNNILTGVLGHINMARLSVNKEYNIARHLDQAEKAAWRAKSLTQQLLTFSKGGAPVKKETSIEELIRESARFATSGSNVTCRFDLSPDLWSVEIDEGQINQVIQNMVINADQAMPEGGEIIIIGRNVNLKRSSVLPLKAGKFVKISIQDRGTGIPEKHLDKIFDPYFSTKQKGSGLGLTICYHILKKHGGHIDVISNREKGALFNVYLPASGKSIQTGKALEAEILRGEGRVLVLDDDEVVREVIASMLTEIGYEAELSSRSADTLHLFEQAIKSGCPFDAVILDLTVPGDKGGVETLKVLRKIDPKVKAIVSSGYSNDPVMARHKKYGFNGVLVKPYKTRHLGEVLKRVMAEKP